VAEPSVDPSGGNGYRSVAASPDRDRGWRARAARHRNEGAATRDHLAGARDRLAQARDQAAASRDRATAVHEATAVEDGAPAELVTLLREVRLAAAAQRERAAADRAAAAADRRMAAEDRRQADLDRHYAGIDDLTGLPTRAAGALALSDELDRADRSGRPAVLALLDVDGLKAVNDRAGHDAGDALLRSIAGAIQAALRSYDVTARWGGDEFVCVMSEIDLNTARGRMEEIGTELDRHWPSASFSVGLAEAGPDESLLALISRADEELYRAKQA
jgi:two-component system cell cycle response regulator